MENVITEFLEIVHGTREKSPLINAITNFITVNDCANILLATGASPCMAYDIREVEEIVSISQGLVVNLGSIEDDRAMLVATQKANEINIPSVFDAVAAGASSLRNELCQELLKKVKFSVIRGNISEIKSLAIGTMSTKGVDANVADAVNSENINDVVRMTQDLSRRTGSVIAVSGAIDVVSDAEKTYVVHNGHPMMARITGSGCMLTCLIAAYCAANPQKILDATAAAICTMGICGEYAHQKTLDTGGGTLSFRTHLIDYVSKLDDDMIIKGARIEIY